MNRLLRALEKIERSLAEPIGPADIAEAAALSPHHFCRYFRAMTGHSVMGYVRARRLSIAVQKLAGRDDRIVDIAFDAGFESQEAFTRAFKRRFGTTPGAVRREGTLLDPTLFQPSLSEAWLLAKREATEMDAKIMELDSFTAIGPTAEVRKDGTEAIPDLWAAFHARHHEIPGADDTGAFGLCLHEAGNVDSFQYVAGARTAPDAEPPNGMRKVSVPGGTYAVFTMACDGGSLPDSFRKAYAYIFETWLPENPYRMVPDVPDFERYDSTRFDPKSLKGEVDICLRVEAAG